MTRDHTENKTDPKPSETKADGEHMTRDELHEHHAEAVDRADEKIEDLGLPPFNKARLLGIASMYQLQNDWFHQLSTDINELTKAIVRKTIN